MYRTYARRCFIGNGFSNTIEKVKFPWIRQKREIQTVSKDSVKQPREKREQDLSYDNVANLKFDPSDTVTDFTSFGILPFLQEKLNHLLVPNQRIVTSAPDYNISPTQDQRTLLSVLNSGHSLIHRGASQSGKSLALATYALNHTLSRVPNFGALKSNKLHQSVDSIILVPTDFLIGKYEYFIRNLSKNIPSICCPDQLFPDESDTYSVKRRPLTVKFLFSDETCHTLCTSDNPTFNSETPQILITTSSRLYDIMNGKPLVDNLNKDNLNDLRFFAVDDMEFLLNTTNICGEKNTNLIKSGKKSKYMNKIEKIINDLQTLQVKYYSANLFHRLKYVERVHRNINKDSNNKFDHVKFVLEDNKLSTSNVSLSLKHTLKDNFKDLKLDESLIKKLIKVKRKVLYKPIQYSFIFHPKHSYQQLLLQMSNKKYQKAFNDRIMREIQKTNHSLLNTDKKFREECLKYLLEKVIRNDQRQEDSQINYVEKLIRFDDSKRFYRKQERKIVSVGSFNLEANQNVLTTVESCEENKNAASKIKAHFIEAFNDQKNHNKIILKDIGIIKNFPNKTEQITLLENDVKVSRYNIKNALKGFLKYRFLSKSLSMKKKNFVNKNQATMIQIIKSSMLHFRSECPLNLLPMLIIVPPSVNLCEISSILNNNNLTLDRYICLSDEKFNSITHELGKSNFDYSFLQDFFLSQSPKEKDSKTNLIVHPHQLIGQNMNGLSNMMVVGIESMLPHLALGSDDLNVLDVAGIEDPVGDLLYFYLSKLSSSSLAKQKNFLFILDNSHKTHRIHSKENKSTTSSDLQRLSQIILYNDLPEYVDVTTFCDDEISTGYNELVYGIDTQFMQRIKTVTARPVNK